MGFEPRALRFKGQIGCHVRLVLSPSSTVAEPNCRLLPVDRFLVSQESEELRDVQDEFENNRSTKISQKEVDELMQELFEAYELDQEVNKQAKKHKRKDFPVS